MSTSYKKSLIFYADDDQDDLDLLLEAFSRYGEHLEIRSFTEGERLLEELSVTVATGHMPCLIILDINMPGLGGKEILPLLKRNETFSHIPVVLFTNSNLPHDQEFAHRHGAGFVTKPLNFHQMGIISDELLGYCVEEVKKRIGMEK